ncbi:MAG: RHS repeat-associated core domain-containing protein, partial [Nitrospiraceae bacterium]|nr:RHS repeat-associated core domain-containing protein [Nitrospiraceae bacterium]
LLAMVVPATDQVYCYHFNPVGSTVAITDGAQNIVSAYSYDPFGNIAASQENMNGTQPRLAGQPFKFVGQFGVMTEPNGFYYMRARYYDPQVGRFISEDPAGFNGGDVNLYNYVGANPVNGIDPAGLLTIQIGFAGTGGAGAGGIYERGFAISYNSEKGLQYGFYKTAGGGGYGGIGASGTLNITVSNNKSIGNLRGTSGSVGGSITLPTPTVVQPTIGGSVNINQGALPSYTLSIGAATPKFTSVEEHGFATNTTINK